MRGKAKTRLPGIRSLKKLREVIIEQRPVLDAALKTGNTVRAAILIRGFVSDFACLSTKELIFTPPSILTAYRIFNSMAGGVWAEGCAKFFSMCLNLFSIPAVVYGYSDETLNMRHEITLFWDKENDKVYAMDAYLNFHFIHSKTGRVMDFETLVTAVKAQEFKSIGIKETPVSRPYVAQTEDSVHNRWLFSSPEIMLRNLDLSWPGVWVYHNARPSLTGLMEEGLLKDICDQCCGHLKLRDFLLSLMLSNPVFHSQFKNRKIMNRLNNLV